MANVAKKHYRNRSRRRLAAISFLSNISLDGSHRDTNFAPVNSRNKQLDDSEENKKEILDSDSDCQKRETGQSGGSSRVRVKPVKGSKAALHGGKSSRQKGTDRIKPGKVLNSGITSSDKSLDVTTSPQSRWRASSFTSEKEKSVKQKLIELLPESLQPVKENVAQTSDREGRYRRSSSMSAESSDSLTKESHFLSPDRKKSAKNGRKSHTEEGRPRHHSGSRSVSSQEGIPSVGLQPIKLEDGQDISYYEYLEPTRKKRIRRVLSETGVCSESSSTSVAMAGVARQQGREYVRSHSHDPSMLSSSPPSIPVLERVPEENEDVYDPNVLDDPDLQLETCRKSLQSHSSSVKPSYLKKELNEKFRDRYPNVQLTLTKLRSLKRELLNIAHVKCGVDLWTIAQAYVFFEKLILKHLVTKSNRKLCAAACMFLSAKINDIKFKGPELDKLLETLEDDFRLHRKEMMSFEFAVLVALEFAILTPDNEIYTHYQRLLDKS